MKRELLALCVILLLGLPSMVRTYGGEGLDGRGDFAPPFDVGHTLPKALSASEVRSLLGSPFVENLGQLDDANVRLYSDGDQLSVGFCKGRVTFAVRDGGGISVFSLVLDGASDVEPRGAFPEVHRSSYFIGSDPARWVGGAGAFAEVWYDGPWDGIDLRFYRSGGRLKYDLIVEAGASTGPVSFQYEGASGTSIETSSGDLLVDTPAGILRDTRPIVLQQGLRPEGIPASFLLRADGRVGFLVGPEVRLDAPFVIDPGLEFSSFIGGGDIDHATSVAFDDDGNVYVAGDTRSSNFPTTAGAYSSTPQNGFVAKLDPDGSSLLAATYFGGSNDTMEKSVDVREDGSVIVVGNTESWDFPTTPGAYDRSFNGDVLDAYVLVLDSGLTTLAYGSFFGGSGDDECELLRDWPDGRLTICGATDSRDLPATPGAFCGTAPGTTAANIFLATFGSTLSSLEQCTYLGGVSEEKPSGIFVDGTGHVYVTGYTYSKDFPTSAGAYCSTVIGHEDAFAVKMEPDLSSIAFGTLVGGSDRDMPFGIAAATDGATYVAGDTRSPDLPVTVDAWSDHLEGNGDDFLVKISGDGRSLIYCTYWGGTGLEQDGSLVYDAARGILSIGGMTSSTDLPTTSGCYNDAFAGGYCDIYVATFNATNMMLSYCTYIGGSGDIIALDVFRGAAVAPDGGIVVVGSTTSDDFPTTTGAYKPSRIGNTDGILFKIVPTPSGPPPAVTGLEATPGDGTIDLVWDRQSGQGSIVNHYHVFRGEAPGAEAYLAEVRHANGYFDEGLVNGKYYYYRVSAVNSAGEGPMSDEIKARPLGSPSEPLNLRYRTGDGRIALTWDPPAYWGGSAVSGYNVLRGILSTEILPYATIGNVTEYADAAVDIGEFYFYKVQAVNERGPGNISAFVRGKALDVPSVPGELRATPGDRQVRLEWSMPSRDGGSMLLGFRIYRGTSASAIALVATKGITELAHTDTGLVNGGSYLYYVVAFSEVGEGDPTITVDAIPFTLPGKPSGITAVAGDGWVLLTWAPPESDGGRQVAFYNIYSGDAAGSLALLVRIGNVTSFNHTGVTNGITYHYQVQAVTGGGEGSRSDEATARPMGLPGVPTQLAAANVAGGVKLTWKAPTNLGGADELYYIVLRGESASALVTIAPHANLLEWTDTSAVGGTTYFYAVRAASAVGAGPATAAVELVVMGIPGQVVGLAATPGDGRVVLTWSAPTSDGGSPVTGHAILRGLLETGMVEIARAGPGLNYTDVTAANGKRYFYAVRAINAVGLGPTGPLVNATPIGAPGAVGLLKAKASGSGIVLTWAAPAASGRAAVTGYVVHRGTSATDLTVLAEVGNVLTYTDATAEKGKTYYYSVAPKSAVGDGQQAVAVSAKVPKEEGGPGYTAIAMIIALGLVTALASKERKRRADRE